MKYIVIEIQTNSDDSVSTLVSSYEERNAAEQKYHLILSAAAVSQLPYHAAVMLTNEGQMVDHKSYYHQPQVIPEPEDEGGSE